MHQRHPTPPAAELFATLESDRMLPEQFFPQRHPSWSGELALLWAVFIDGVESFRKEILRGTEDSEVFTEILDWIYERESDSVFSFDRLCETFELDSGRAQSSLEMWRERHHAPTLVTVPRSEAA
jgi:hypothetical protein